MNPTISPGLVATSAERQSDQKFMKPDWSADQLETDVRTDLLKW